MICEEAVFWGRPPRGGEGNERREIDPAMAVGMVAWFWLHFPQHNVSQPRLGLGPGMRRLFFAS